jgi:alginate O-acetyltransferase complex protein AlgI
VAAQPSLFKVALYKTFFPQLIAGPIVRYRDIKQSIDKRHTSVDDFAEGAYRFAVGLAQKVLIANTVGQAADVVFRLQSGQLGVLVAWVAAMCYTFQIYYDFAGYSNMAIGMGRIFGFRLLENFAHPYAARSISEFWRRWHISLSTWFRDYLFIPLGGSRGSALQTYRNLFIVFFLCGLWHGASWTFIVWGLFHGSLLSLERAGLGQMLARVPGVVRRIYALGAVIVGWVIFRCDTLARSWEYLRTMFGFGERTPFHMPVQQIFTPELGVALLFAAFFAVPHPRLAPAWERAGSPPLTQVAYTYLAFVACLGLSLVYLAGASFNPFIYFRF